MKRLRARLTYANVMATIAVFIALGGASYAALKLPKNSVGTKQLKKGAVSLNKIKRAARTELKGQKGDQGPQGAPGVPATRIFAHVLGQTGVGEKAVVSAGNGVTGVTMPSAGSYMVQFDRSLSGCALLATVGSGVPSGTQDVSSPASVAVANITKSDPTQALVETTYQGAFLPRSFFIAAFC
jgi:hypothetical protein